MIQRKHRTQRLAILHHLRNARILPLSLANDGAIRIGGRARGQQRHRARDRATHRCVPAIVVAHQLLLGAQLVGQILEIVLDGMGQAVHEQGSPQKREHSEAGHDGPRPCEDNKEPARRRLLFIQ